MQLENIKIIELNELEPEINSIKQEEFVFLYHHVKNATPYSILFNMPSTISVKTKYSGISNNDIDLYSMWLIGPNINGYKITKEKTTNFNDSTIFQSNNISTIDSIVVCHGNIGITNLIRNIDNPKLSEIKQYLPKIHYYLRKLK